MTTPNKMRTKLKVFALKVVNQWDGTPVPDDALREEMRDRFQSVMEADVSGSLRDAEQEGLLMGVRNDITKKITWTLTAKAIHALPTL